MEVSAVQVKFSPGGVVPETEQSTTIAKPERGINLAASLITLVIASSGTAAWLGRHNQVVQLLAASLGGFFSGWLAIRIWRKLKPTPIPRRVIDGFHIERVELNYTIDEDPHHHIYTSAWRIRAIRSGVKFVEQRFWWSGRGKVDLSVISDGHKKMGPSQRYGYYEYFYVFLGRELALGDKTEIVHKIDMQTDELCNVQPFLRRTCYVECDEIMLRVAFPQRGPKIKAICTVERLADDAPLKTEEAKVDQGRNVAEWLISRPTVGHSYTLRWAWPESWVPDTSDELGQLRTMVPQSNSSQTGEQ